MTTETKISDVSPLTDYKPIEEADTEVLNSQTLQTFAFGNADVRVVMKGDNPWFVANDICEAINLINPRKSVAALDKDEKDVTISYTLGGQQETTIISESGLYSIILRSRKPEARQFRRWVTHEVIPQIRKTGSYSAVQHSDWYAEVSKKLDILQAKIMAYDETPALPEKYAEPLYTAQDLQPQLEKSGIIKPIKLPTLAYKTLVSAGYAYKDKSGYHPTSWAHTNKLAVEIVKRDNIVFGQYHCKTTTVGLTEKGRTKLFKALEAEQ